MKDSMKWLLFSNTRRAAKIRFGLDILMLFIGGFLLVPVSIALFENTSVLLRLGVYAVFAVFTMFAGLIFGCGIAVFGALQESTIIFTSIKKRERKNE